MNELKDKIKSVKIDEEEDRQFLTIELNRDDDFKFIFIDADKLVDIAKMLEKWD